MESLLSVWIVAVIVIWLLGTYHWSRRSLYLLGKSVPGPWALPVVGNGLKFIRKEDDLLHIFTNLVDKYPSPMRLWMGPKLILVVKDPHHLQIILQSSKITTKAFLYRYLEPFLGSGLFTASGIYHKNHRRLLQPLFSQKIIEGYSHLFQKHANKLVEQIRKHADKNEFDISLYLHDSAFESAMDVLLEDKNDHSIDYKDIPQFVRRFYNIIFTRVRKFWLHFDCIYNKSWYFKQQMMMKEVATTMINEIINTRVPELERRVKNNEQPNDARTPSMLEKMTEMVYHDPNCLTTQECTDHLMTFMATSQDTQSSAIGFTCMMLGAHPDIQNRVVQELHDVLGSRTSLDFTDVSKLKYLDMCVKESLRLYPVAPFIFRDTTEDFQLEKLTIPKGVTVTLSIYHVHRDPNCWEKPEEFYPEHFTEEAVNRRPTFAFVPFSAGPRKCIAQQYSYTNMKIIIGSILLNYELECQRKVKDIKLATDISIRPVGGYLIKLKSRG